MHTLFPCSLFICPYPFLRGGLAGWARTEAGLNTSRNGGWRRGQRALRSPVWRWEVVVGREPENQNLLAQEGRPRTRSIMRSMGRKNFENEVKTGQWIQEDWGLSKDLNLMMNRSLETLESYVLVKWQGQRLDSKELRYE